MCFHSAIKHENDVRNMVSCLQLQMVRIYSVMKEAKLTRASYIVFLIVKLKNNKCIKEIKHAFLAFMVW